MKVFENDPIPKNPLKDKWDKKYPIIPRTCDGYSCMFCNQCPSGEYWKCPEEDLEEYTAYLKKFEEWEKRHPNYLEELEFEIKIE